MIRGDDDINALFSEFDTSSSTGDDVAAVSTTGAPDSSGVDDNNADVFLRAFTLSPPSNPTVEIIRHRIHEKFKSNVYDAIRSCAPSDEALLKSSSANAKRNHYYRSVIATVWNDMPAHNIWERFQFSLKALEADCVREIQSSSGLLPWMQQKMNVEHFLNPSTLQICSWLMQSKSHGTAWEPLIPVSSICDGESFINQKYIRASKDLLEKELQFQFRRSFKRCLGGADKNKAGRKPKQALSLDEMYSTTKSYAEEDKNSSQSSDEEDKKKKKHKHKDNTSKTDKEELVLQHLFESHAFNKATQKLHKKLQYLYDDSQSKFMKQLKKVSDQSIQQQGSNRKKGKHAMPKISFDDDSNEYEKQSTVTFGGISLRINEGHMIKLKSLYGATMSKLGCVDEQQQYFSQALFTLLLRYDALEGAGLQSAIPPQVFRWMHSRFGCSWECFASPFNCWLENNTLGGKFGSAFGDTDSVFSSAGSFFDIDFLALAKKEGGGCFQANPPFASKFIESMCSRMHQFLVGTGDTDTDGVPIMFVIFVPAWRESLGWKALESSPYLTWHTLLLQKEDEHFYAEGTQHRRKKNDNSKTGDKNDRHGSHRIASFDSSVFFLQNAAAQEKWHISNEDEKKLKLAFAMNLPEDAAKKYENKGHLSQQESKTPAKESKKDPTRITTKSKRKKAKSVRKDNPDKSIKKKPKLLKGGNDEMVILASLGLVGAGSEEAESKKKAEHRQSKK